MDPEKDIFEQIQDLEARERTTSIERRLLLEKALASNDAQSIFKAQSYIQRQQKVDTTVGKSMLIDPYSLNKSNGYAEKQFTISYTVLRNMSRIPIIKSIIETRVEQIVAFAKPQSDKYSTGFVIRPKKIRGNQEDKEKLTKQEEKDIEEITEFLLNCGTNENEWHGDTLESLLRKFLPDCLALDQGTFEVVRNKIMEPVEVIATDGATFRIADSWDDDTYVGDKKKIDGHYPSYVQVWDGRIIADFYPWELCFGVRNPQSSIYSNGYGRSELEDLIQTVTSILHADQYNANYFKLGSNPKGILKVSGNINTSRIEEFRGQWQTQMAGVANCIHGDTLIWTKEFGGQEVENIIRGQEEQLITIWTGTSWEKANLYKTDKKTINITRLNNGVEVKTSPEHRFAIINNEGEFDWKKQKELDINDFVLVNKKEITNTDCTLEYNNIPFDGEMMEVLGWMIGDGSLFFKEWDRISRNSKGSISLFYHHDKELDILSKHKEVLERYGLKVEEVVSTRTPEQIEKTKRKYRFKTVSRKHYSLRIINKDFVRYLLKIGFQTSTDGKVIPESIFQLPSAHRCSFLKGFFSADGNKEGKIGARITIKDNEVRKQTRNLLLSVGIRTTSCEESKIQEYFDGILLQSKFLTVRDKVVFNQKVGFIQDHKQPDSESNVIEDKQMFPKAVIDKYLSIALEKHKKENNIFTERQLHDIRSVIKRNESCTYNRLVNYLSIANIEIPSFWGDYYFEKVVDLKSTSESIQMYDIEVFDDIHAFVGDGVIIHNSHRMPIIEADKLDFINTQTSNKDMEYSKYYEFLIKIACACYKIDPSEIGFPMNGSSESKPMFEGNNEARLKYSKDKGMKPLLNFVQTKLNKYIVQYLKGGKYELYFEGIDAETAQEELENDIKKINAGLMDLETGMAKYGHKLNEKKDIILNPAYLQYLQMKQMGGEESNEFMDQEEEADQEETTPNPFEKALQKSWDRLMIKD